MSFDLLECIFSNLANVATAFLGIGTVAAFSIRWHRSRSDEGMKQPLVRAAKMEEKVFEDLGRPNLAAMTGIIFRDPVRRHFTEFDTLAEWLTKPGIFYGRHSSDRAGPQWHRLASPLSRLLRLASQPQTASFFQRVLFQTETSAFADRMSEIANLLERFGQCDPVSKVRMENPVCLNKYPPIEKDDQVVSFRHFVSALSGAVILSETTAARSRYAERVFLWHSRSYHGCEAKDGYTSYDDVHGEKGCCNWKPNQHKPGDYDLRLLNLQSVALAEATKNGYLAFTLETSETCYAATEGGNSACKKVPGEAVKAKTLGPLFSLTDWGALREPIEAKPQKRTVLLTSYVTLLTTDDHLVLVKRSGKVRNGAGVLSATAGGVMEPGAPGPLGHVDAAGMPDPIVCAIHEAKEEIGVDLPYDAVSPVAVFLTNIRERLKDQTGSDRYDKKGQLVGVVLSLAQVPYDRQELELHRSQFADPARGAFEVEKFQFVPLKIARNFDEKKSDDGCKKRHSYHFAKPTNEKESVSRNLATWAYKNADYLDQHGFLSLVFTAAVIDGPDTAAPAFAEVFAKRPWWSRENGETRILVDPRDLVNESDCIQASGLVDWQTHWDKLKGQ